ncbi:MAG TPA: 50S ribosomal protein L1 [Candidatus Enterousia intestinigallinarum]|uniref:Large ribosomal subunit protein uL1 n=1 Tax=Candidatus Enterousia intestinigallinarum TaxID=2840790 RepID=A0A9D1JVS1_9PROT|nr:50S ribosomal protein L1 [Candidatus Enterousia intestinigallinarum]
MKLTKRQQTWAKLDKEQVYSLADAIDALREYASKKFDESLEIAIRLGVDVTKADQNIRGMVSLPNGTGKTVRVAVFTVNSADEAKKAGADIVGGEDLIEKVAAGEINFDRVIATPDMMPKMSKIARVLGPKGLMPNPKLGTVTNNVAEAVATAKAGQIEYRAEKKGIIHAGVGKMSFTTDKLVENVNALVDQLKKVKPASVKGQYILGAAIATTQGPGLKVDIK